MAMASSGKGGGKGCPMSVAPKDWLNHLVALLKPRRSSPHTPTSSSSPSHQRRLQAYQALERLIPLALQAEQAGELLEAAVAVIAEHIAPAGNIGILLHQPERRRLVLAAHHGEELMTGTEIPDDAGLSGQALRTGRSILAARVEEHPQFWRAHASTQSEVNVPIKGRRRIHGVISVESPQPNAFDQEHLFFLELLGELLGLTLDALENRQTAFQRLQELEALHQLNNALRTTQKSNLLIPVLLRQITQTLGANSAALFLSPAPHQPLRLMACYPFTRSTPPPLTLEQDTFPREPVLLTAQAPALPKGLTTLGPPWDHALRYGLAYLPLSRGLLAVAFTNPHQAEQISLTLFGLLARTADTALSHTLLQEHLHHEVQHLRSLHAIDQTIANAIPREAALQTALHHLVADLGVRGAAILGPADAGFTFPLEQVTCIAHHGRIPSLIPNLNLPLPALVTHRSNSAHPLLFDRLDLHHAGVLLPNLREALLREGFTAFAAVPLLLEGHLIGQLELYHDAPFPMHPGWRDHVLSYAN